MLHKIQQAKNLGCIGHDINKLIYKGGATILNQITSVFGHLQLNTAHQINQKCGLEKLNMHNYML